MSSVRVFPSSLPTALADGHGFQLLENARPRARDQGESRMRPRWYTVPERCTVRWRFTQTQFDAFHAFHEGTLLSGSLDFDVLVQRRGEASGTSDGVTWYTALFEGEYSFEVDKTQRYVVSATLRLVEELGPERVPPSIESSIVLNFGMTARTLPPLLTATISLPFGLQALMPTGPAGATISLNFGMVWTVEDPAPESSDRETEAGLGRDTESGESRTTG